MKWAMLLLCATLHASAQHSCIAAVNLDRVNGATGGGASLTWLHPRGNDTFHAGATLFSLAGSRWAYGTLGDTRRLRTIIVNGEASLGGGEDARGSFPYMLLRGGAMRELVPRRFFGDAELLYADAARQQDAIVRVGGTWMRSPLTLRASVYRSFAGDADTRLAFVRADYDFRRATAIVGASAGSTGPALQQRPTSDRDVRDVFAGITIDKWSVIATHGRKRVSLSVLRRIGG
jgi:hypothetical protein